MYHFYMNLSQYSKYYVSTVYIDVLVLYHQGSSSSSADYASIHF